MKVYNKKMELAYKKAKKNLDSLLKVVDLDTDVRAFVQRLFIKKYLPESAQVKRMVEEKVKEVVQSEFILDLVTKKLVEDAIERRLLNWTDDLQKSMTEKIKRQMNMTIDRFDPDNDPDY